MSTFVPTKHNLREALLFCFHLKKKAAEGHQMLLEAYGEHAPSIKTCEYWYRKFKEGDFDTEDKERSGRGKTFEDVDLEAFLGEDSRQTQEQLAESLGVTQPAVSMRLKAMGMIQKQGNWVPYELKPRDVERRFFACEQLLERQRRKGFLHRIVTGDEKWIHYDNPKRNKSFLDTHQHRRQDRTFMDRSFCFVSGGTSWEWCTMNCLNRMKPSLEIATDFS